MLSLQNTIFNYSKFLEQVTKMRHLGTTELEGRKVHHHVFDSDTSRDVYSLYEFQEQAPFTTVSIICALHGWALSHEMTYTILPESEIFGIVLQAMQSNMEPAEKCIEKLNNLLYILRSLDEKGSFHYKRTVFNGGELGATLCEVGTANVRILKPDELPSYFSQLLTEHGIVDCSLIVKVLVDTIKTKPSPSRLLE